MATSFSKITLGTAQLGMRYGIANRQGTISDKDASTLLELARERGITSFDTAPAYGNAESRIGSWLSSAAPDHVRSIYLITKLAKVGEDVPENSWNHVVARGLERSLKRLGVESVALVLAHNAADLTKSPILDCLRHYQVEGRIEHIGASVYDTKTAHQLLDRNVLSAIQIPFSVADRRFSTSGVTDRARQMGVTVFGRSVFLQGALLLAHDTLPEHLQRLRKPLARLNEVAKHLDVSLANLLLRATAFDPQIDSAVVGVETADQLIELTTAMDQGPLESYVVEELSTVFRGLPSDILHPGKWPETSGAHTTKPDKPPRTHYS